MAFLQGLQGQWNVWNGTLAGNCLLGSDLRVRVPDCGEREIDVSAHPLEATLGRAEGVKRQVGVVLGN